MNISHDTLIKLASESFESVKALADSSKPGCKLARKHISEAAKHGLDVKPYLVRDGMCYGWSNEVSTVGKHCVVSVGRVAPLFGVSPHDPC